MQVREISKQELHVLNDDGSIIAGVNIGYYRPWIYPLCTPSGINVLREFPPDHGFHNGAFFGHYPVNDGETKHNFWGAPPFRGENDNMSENIGHIQSVVQFYKVRVNRAEVQLRCAWITKFNDPLIQETRTYFLHSNADAIALTTNSRLQNISNKPLTFENTKCSGHTYRLSTEFCPRNETYIAKGNTKLPIQCVHCVKPPVESFSIVNKYGRITFENREGYDVFVREYGLVSINPFFQKTAFINPGAEICFSSNLVLSR